MAFIDLLEKDVIKVPLESTEKNGILKELIDVLKKAGKISETEEVYKALRAREDQCSTGLEEGVAVPHAKTSAVQKLTLALGIAPDGVDYEALDGKPSKVFFMMLAPPDQSGPHIQALSEIARMTQSASLMRLLVSSRTPEEILELFTE